MGSRFGETQVRIFWEPSTLNASENPGHTVHLESQTGKHSLYGAGPLCVGRAGRLALAWRRLLMKELQTLAQDGCRIKCENRVSQTLRRCPQGLRSWQIFPQQQGLLSLIPKRDPCVGSRRRGGRWHWQAGARWSDMQGCSARITEAKSQGSNGPEYGFLVNFPEDKGRG